MSNRVYVVIHEWHDGIDINYQIKKVFDSKEKANKYVTEWEMASNSAINEVISVVPYSVE